MTLKYAEVLVFRSDPFITPRRKKNETNLKKKIIKTVVKKLHSNRLIAQ